MALAIYHGDVNNNRRIEKAKTIEPKIKPGLQIEIISIKRPKIWSSIGIRNELDLLGCHRISCIEFNWKLEAFLFLKKFLILFYSRRIELGRTLKTAGFGGLSVVFGYFSGIFNYKKPGLLAKPVPR